MSSRKHTSHHSSKDSSQKGKNKSHSYENQASTSKSYTSSSSEYWCEVCALHIQNCRCVPYDHAAASNTWQNLQVAGNTSSAVTDPAYFDPNAFTWNAGISDQNYGGADYYANSPGQVVSPQMYTTGTSPSTGGSPGTRGSSATDNERRQKANRNSQRKHRLNQMKVVEDLKHQVSDLTSKNQKMSKKISALDQGQIYQVEGAEEEGGEGMKVLVHAGTDQIGGYVMPWGEEEEEE